jgi:hypothetical protein
MHNRQGSTEADQSDGCHRCMKLTAVSGQDADNPREFSKLGWTSWLRLLLAPFVVRDRARYRRSTRR